MPMSNDEIAELTWENGQLGMHEFGGICRTWDASTSADTLECVVHQATICNKESGLKNVASVVASSSGGRWVGEMNGLVEKRTRSESDPINYYQKKFNSSEEDPSACASANAAFCRDNNSNDKTMITYDSSRSTRTKTTDFEDSACNAGSENQEEGRATKCEKERSHSTRKGRAAAVHNQSERRRRDRINQKMKALQKLVPNASKTDKASMLDEVIEYLKQLQAQVQMMSARNMSQHLMMPLGMQQQLQMAILARAGMGVGLGMGMGMGMLNMNMTNQPLSTGQHLASLIQPTSQVGTTGSTFVPQPPSMLVPPVVSSSAPQQGKPDQGTSSLAPLPDPYNAFFNQPMNMEMYNRMAALYRQQMGQSTKASSHMQLNPLQGS